MALYGLYHNLRKNIRSVPTHSRRDICILLFYGFTFLIGETSLHSTDASIFGIAQPLFTTSSYWLTLFTVTVGICVESPPALFFPEDVHVAQYIAYQERQQRGGLGKVKVLDMACWTRSCRTVHLRCCRNMGAA